MADQKKVCLITGGTSGIGLATVKRFSQQGYCIATCGRNQKRIDELGKLLGADSPQYSVRRVDLDDVRQTRTFFEQAIENFGQIDVLINNAAVSPLAPIDELTIEQFESSININIRSPFYLMQLAWNSMRQQGRGVIVNLSSLAAIDPFPGFSIYGASKAWLDIMTHSLAGEGQPHGIRVYSLRCGAVETPMLRSLFPDFPAEQCVSPETVADKILACVEQPDLHQSGEKIVVANQN